MSLELTSTSASELIGLNAGNRMLEHTKFKSCSICISQKHEKILSNSALEITWKLNASSPAQLLLIFYLFFNKPFYLEVSQNMVKYTYVCFTEEIKSGITLGWVYYYSF